MGDDSAFDEGLELTWTFLDIRCVNAGVGQPDVEVLLAFHGSAKVQPRAHRNAGFVQQSLTEGIIVG